MQTVSASSRSCLLEKDTRVSGTTSASNDFQRQTDLDLGMSHDGSEEDFGGDDGDDQSPEQHLFDQTVGELEMILMSPEFQEMRDSFVEKNCHVFDANEENKLEYMILFKQYSGMIESHLSEALASRVPGFSMEWFMKYLAESSDDTDNEVFELLASMGDFMAFKELMLSYRPDMNAEQFGISVTRVVDGKEAATE
eukprot:GDKH01002642.1.p1 GENE.GDKH01002642.1~~GDKH01002642.1.p1  ORF type:complete len:196 (-),score=36.22 GDKH01002642.1:207-794(-)